MFPFEIKIDPCHSFYMQNSFIHEFPWICFFFVFRIATLDNLRKPGFKTFSSCKLAGLETFQKIHDLYASLSRLGRLAGQRKDHHRFCAFYAVLLNIICQIQIQGWYSNVLNPLQMFNIALERSWNVLPFNVLLIRPPLVSE